MYPRSPRPLELWLWRHLPGKTDDGPLEQHDVFRWISNTRHPLEGACRPAAQSPDIASGTTAPCRRGAARPCIARGRRPSRSPARHSAANCTPLAGHSVRSGSSSDGLCRNEGGAQAAPAVDIAIRNSEVPPGHSPCRIWFGTRPSPRGGLARATRKRNPLRKRCWWQAAPAQGFPQTPPGEDSP
jgi:hypothetical protein